MEPVVQFLTELLAVIAGDERESPEQKALYKAERSFYLLCITEQEQTSPDFEPVCLK